jgi:hypothetical protein
MTKCDASPKVGKHKIIYVANGCVLGNMFWGAIVRFTVDSETLKDHGVLSDSACFVTENIVNSPQLFMDLGILHLALSDVFDEIIRYYHVSVSFNSSSVYQLHELQHHYDGNGK